MSSSLPGGDRNRLAEPEPEPIGRTGCEPIGRTGAEPFGRTRPEPIRRTGVEPFGRTAPEPLRRTVSGTDNPVCHTPRTRGHGLRVRSGGIRGGVTRKGSNTTEWVQMRKGVAYLFRYRDVGRSANSRYLDAFSVVSDPTAQVRQIERVTRRKTLPSGRSAKALNPLSREDAELFKAVMAGEHILRGFRNADLRHRLRDTGHLGDGPGDPRRSSAKVSRILHRLHAHGLIAKAPHARRWRTTTAGRRLMATTLQLRQVSYPQLLAMAA